MKRMRNLKGLINTSIMMCTLTSFPLFGTASVHASSPMVEKVMQNHRISGEVKDINGEPIIGASVVEKGTSNGVVTDLNGKFVLTCHKNARIVISFVGYITQEVTTQDKQMTITLREDTEMLDEVVVVGYGTQRKEELTSSVESVKAENFIQSANPDAASLIRGKVAGLTIVQADANPLSTAQIMLRGVTTLKSNAAPLVIIDGVPGNINDVSPNDIEQIDVLKDGSAAAIYGTRGTNGVIIITTNRSKGEMKPTFSFNSYLSTQQITKQLDVMTTDEYLQKVNQGVTGTLNHGGRTDWMDEIMQTPFNQTYSANLKGGTKHTNYLVSIDYTSNEGLVKKSNVEVLYPRMFVEHRMFNDKVKLEAQLSGYHRTYGIPYNNNVYNSALVYNPTYNLYNEEGGWNEEGSNSQRFNPVALLEETKAENKDTKVKMYGKATVNPLKGLTVSYLVSKEIGNFFGGYYETMHHKSTTMDGKNGYASRTTSRTQDDLMELTAQYTKSLGDHSLNALAGYHWSNYNYEYAFMDNYNFPSDDFSYNNMSKGSALVNGKAKEVTEQTESRLVGYFARINYNYAGKYFLSASVRHEGSSKFGADHKWGTFPAVSVGWNISREHFMQHIKALSNLKLRLGYGVTGTVPGSSYMSLNRLDLGGYGYYKGEWINMLKPSGNANPDLRWEKKKELNIGIDFGFLNNRISGSIDYYQRTTDDLIWDYSVPVPPYINTSITANAGTIKNKGLEVNVNVVPIETKDFVWNANLNFSTNRNELVSLSNDKFVAGSYVDAGMLDAPIQQRTHRLEEGEAIGNFYGYKSIGVDDDGRWIIEGADGQPKPIAEQLPTDKKVIGNGLPDWYLNFNNTFHYKQFDLSLTMRGAFGFQILNTPKMYYGTPASLGNTNALTSAFDEVYGKRALASEQELQYVSYFVEDGDYWKIDNVTLGWTPRLKVDWIQKLRVYASISNLATITGYSGIDPEVSISGLTPGIDDKFRYPAARTYTFGLQLTF